MTKQQENSSGNLLDSTLQKRQLTNWIAAFCDYTKHTPSPEIFRKWAAVSAVAGALERRVWIHTAGGPIYPNMFIVLISPPGVGKDQAINPMRDLWAATGRLSIAPISMTNKGMIDQLADESSHKQYVVINDGKQEWVNYHSLLIAVPELGVMIDKYDLGYISALNDLFNCGPLFEEKQRHTRKGEILRIENPHIHLISGTQPKYLGELLPEAAYGMGFTARIIFVYSGIPVKISLFTSRPSTGGLRNDLIKDLKAICDLRGPFTISKEAEQVIEHWHQHGSEKDKPNHSRLVHYNARRIMHILKLCMVFSASRSSSMHIEEEDFHSALSLLLETEAVMPEIFKEMASGGQSAEIEEAFNFLFQTYMRNGKKPIREDRLIHFLSSRVPANQIQYIVETMLKSGLIKEIKPNGLNIPTIYGNRLIEPVALQKVE